MKTSIKSLFATAMIALALSSSAVYANGSTIKNTIPVVADIASIQKIIVTGNVSVNIVQTTKSKVLYRNENNNGAIVKRSNNSITIDGTNSSNGAEITIFVDNIYRIDASGNAIVKTEGILNLKNLQVFVKDNAKVEVNATTESLYTVIKNNGELKLQGHSENHVLTMDKLSKVTLENFSAIKTDKNNSDELTTFAALRN